LVEAIKCVNVVALAVNHVRNYLKPRSTN
jgi:hypothetical protein